MKDERARPHPHWPALLLKITPSLSLESWNMIQLHVPPSHAPCLFMWEPKPLLIYILSHAVWMRPYFVRWIIRARCIMMSLGKYSI